MINFKEELNPEQLQVVEHGDGPCLVLAGAGSGKTRTIIYRVANLLEQGIKPEQILLVTFTNKAAEEMTRRVQKLLTSSNTLPWSGTFHHIAYRLLRIYAPLLGYGNNFTILDSDDSQSLIKLCSHESQTSTNVSDGRRFPSANALSAVMSYARNAELTIDVVLENRFSQWLPWAEEIKKIAAAYQIRKKVANAMDFDDLLTNLLKLLNSDQVRKKYAEQFKYVLVDEYQDTNKIQAAIMKQFASIHHNLLVVGDDAQSIYSFRAADIQNILQFDREYPGATIFKLETNYRSTPTILDVANNVIANNREQYPKNLRSAQPTPEAPLPILSPQMDQANEGTFVAEKIEQLLTQGVEAREIAVLFRAATHSQMLEVELVRRGVAYDYRGGVRFFERAHIKDSLAYLRLLLNPADTAAWLRVLLHEEGIGPAAAQKIIAAVRTTPNPTAIENIGQQILGSKAQLGWNNFISIWKTLQTVEQNSPATLIKTLLDSPYQAYLENEYIDSNDRLADIRQLGFFAERYDSLEQFLAETTLQESFRSISGGNEPIPATATATATKAADHTPTTKSQKTNDKIVLSTIHQAKGLEWSAVFIINLASGAFPNDRAFQEHNGLEEERRLFYVAITRAKQQLFLTYPMAGGLYGDFLTGPSIFLNEINPGLLDDRSFLSTSSSIFNDPSEGIEYIPEDQPIRIKPGSFLKDIEDL